MSDWLRAVGWSTWGAGSYIAVTLWLGSGLGWKDVFILLGLSAIAGLGFLFRGYRASKKDVER